MYKVPNSVLEKIVKHLELVDETIDVTLDSEVSKDNAKLIKLINDNYLQIDKDK